MEKSDNNIIIVLSKQLSKFNFDFYQNFKKKYNIKTFFINDESTDLSKNCIFIGDEDCLRYHIRNFTFTTEKQITAWDRSLAFLNFYYLDKFKFAWFIEDDVYFKNEKILINLINKYKKNNADFLTSHVSNQELNSSWENWHLINDKGFFKKHKSFNCFCRISNKAINKICLYAIKNKNLKYMFHELVFINVCVHENLKVKNFDYSDGMLIRWRPNITAEELNQDYTVYHPAKNIKSLLIKH